MNYNEGNTIHNGLSRNENTRDGLNERMLPSFFLGADDDTERR